MPEALQALDNLASDVLDTFGVFGGKWGGKVIIGDEERLLVVLGSIRETRELVCDRIREGDLESGPRGDGGLGERMSRVRHCLVALLSSFSVMWVIFLIVPRCLRRRAHWVGC
jgi:hypothetical protein